MGVRALSLVKDQPEHFNLAWRGYDRAEVDAFLQQTAADRSRLQADLAQLETAVRDHDVARRRELERLAALRAELARCLETSINALHVANLLLSAPARPVDDVDVCDSEPDECSAVLDTGPAPPVEPPPPGPAGTEASWPLPAWLSPGRTILLTGLALAAAVMFLPAANPILAPSPEPAIAPPSLAAVPELEWLLPAGPTVSIAAPAQPDGPPIAAASAVTPPAAATTAAPGSLVLTLTATSECWIRTTIDGGEPRERLLQPDESITLRATDEAILRIGDPAALRLQINDRPARSLGSAGRVVTTRITLANYLEFLSGN